MQEFVKKEVSIRGIPHLLVPPVVPNKCYFCKYKKETYDTCGQLTNSIMPYGDNSSRLKDVTCIRERHDFIVIEADMYEQYITERVMYRLHGVIPDTEDDDLYDDNDD